LLADGGVLVAWKRGDLGAELASADRALTTLGGGDVQVLDPAIPGLPEHRLVLVTRRGDLPADYPRDPAARKRRPW
jgi:hypothetical protein